MKQEIRNPSVLSSLQISPKTHRKKEGKNEKSKMNKSFSSPFTNIPLLQRIAKFACRHPQEAMSLSYVSSSFSECMNAFHTLHIITWSYLTRQFRPEEQDGGSGSGSGDPLSDLVNRILISKIDWWLDELFLVEAIDEALEKYQKQCHNNKEGSSLSSLSSSSRMMVPILARSLTRCLASPEPLLKSCLLMSSLMNYPNALKTILRVYKQFDRHGFEPIRIPEEDDPDDNNHFAPYQFKPGQLLRSIFLCPDEYDEFIFEVPDFSSFNTESFRILFDECRAMDILRDVIRPPEVYRDNLLHFAIQSQCRYETLKLIFDTIESLEEQTTMNDDDDDDDRNNNHCHFLRSLLEGNPNAVLMSPTSTNGAILVAFEVGIAPDCLHLLLTKCREAGLLETLLKEKDSRGRNVFNYMDQQCSPLKSVHVLLKFVDDNDDTSSSSSSWITELFQDARLYQTPFKILEWQRMNFRYSMSILNLEEQQKEKSLLTSSSSSSSSFSSSSSSSHSIEWVSAFLNCCEILARNAAKQGDLENFIRNIHSFLFSPSSNTSDDDDMDRAIKENLFKILVALHSSAQQYEQSTNLYGYVDGADAEEQELNIKPEIKRLVMSLTPEESYQECLAFYKTGKFDKLL